MGKLNLTGMNLGRYHITEPLGEGGMASVYKAYDTSLERNVAIKIIRTDIEDSNDGEFLKRFQREARALAQLDHPYILKVLDYGEQDGVPYLVMPFVPGGTLKQKMGSALSPQQAASLLAPIANALEYAHQQNIIHRDVKPANILISQSGAPLLSDFGIAKVISGSGATQLTAAGVGIGTPDYMAPEQWMGIADPGTDIYSLGVVFYEMVTGHRPYTADTPAAVMIKHLRDPLPRPSSFIPGLPEEVEQVLFKALAKEPKDRFKSMASFATALEKLANSAATVLSDMPVDVVTLLNPEKTSLVSPVGVQAKTTSQTIPVQGSQTGVKLETWKIILAVVSGLAVIVFLCLLAGGGAFFASRSLLNNKPAPLTPAGTTDQASTQLPSNLAETSAPPPARPSASSKLTSAPEATPTPLQSITGYPEDVPFLKDNNGDLMTSVSQGMQMFSFSSNLSLTELSDFYVTGMKTNNWQVVNEMTQGTTKIWYFMKNDTRMVMISLTSNDNTTRIAVMIPPAK